MDFQSLSRFLTQARAQGSPARVEKRSQAGPSPLSARVEQVLKHESLELDPGRSPEIHAL